MKHKLTPVSNRPHSLDWTNYGSVRSSESFVSRSLVLPWACVSAGLCVSAESSLARPAPALSSRLRLSENLPIFLNFSSLPDQLSPVSDSSERARSYTPWAVRSAVLILPHRVREPPADYTELKQVVGSEFECIRSLLPSASVAQMMAAQDSAGIQSIWHSPS